MGHYDFCNKAPILRQVAHAKTADQALADELLHTLKGLGKVVVRIWLVEIPQLPSTDFGPIRAQQVWRCVNSSAQNSRHWGSRLCGGCVLGAEAVRPF